MKKQKILEHFDCAWSDNSYRSLCDHEKFCKGKDDCLKAKEFTRVLVEEFFKWQKRAKGLLNEGLFEGACGRYSVDKFIHEIIDFGKEKR